MIFFKALEYQMEKGAEEVRLQKEREAEKKRKDSFVQNTLGPQVDWILDYLITNLNQTDLSVVLFSLIALEKFAQTSKL